MSLSVNSITIFHLYRKLVILTPIFLIKSHEMQIIDIEDTVMGPSRGGLGQVTVPHLGGPEPD